MIPITTNATTATAPPTIATILLSEDETVAVTKGHTWRFIVRFLD